ncbi:MAG: mechanosensitive ion channel family protein [Rikenella sp.]|nr:mechanosensitive ion channel family protein [Rikenella sp.]
MLYLVPLGVILFGIDLFFRGFAPALNLVARVAAECVMIFTALLVCFSLLDALNDLYQRSPEAQKRSIKGYIQIGKILAAFLAGILIVADILQKNPTSLLVGLGAAAAVLSLVFRDTLLGFVASIQLSAQDMVRPGDWIEMPGKQADGMVLDINLNSVKVQNWDNTITMIPIYSMVSESFINWRGMERSGGRRFISRFYLDVDSVGLADEGMLARLSSDPSTAELAKATLELARSTSPDRLTNLALFRAHMEVWLFRNPKLNPRMLTFARYLAETSDRGIGLEIYAFTKNTENEYVFDTVKRSVTEHVIGCLPLFGLRLFQKPSAHSLNGILQTPKG